MNVGKILPAEKPQYNDPETGRRVTLWTGETGVNLSLYYHQNAFDARRGFVYFVSNRSGSFQLWRVSLTDGRLTQVSEFVGLGEYCQGADAVEGSYNYAVYVSKRSGKIFAGGRQQFVVIDPDSLRMELIHDERKPSRDPDQRYYRDAYVFPSCDDRWVYTYTVYSSDNEFQAARALSEAAFNAYQKDGRRGHSRYPQSPHGLMESPLEQVIRRIEVASGRVEELWRGHWWIQHVQASPIDPDLVTFAWAGMRRPKPKYHLLRAGETPRVLTRDETNFMTFHDFWHPDGTRWLTHSCENLEPDEAYAPIPGKMRFYVCEVNIADFLKTGEAVVRRWYETAGERHVHMHLNIAPDGTFLVGDGQSDTPFIGRLDRHQDGTVTSKPLCRAGYAPGRPNGCETSPNVQVWPDGRTMFFNTYRGDQSHLASVEL